MPTKAEQTRAALKGIIRETLDERDKERSEAEAEAKKKELEESDSGNGSGDTEGSGHNGAPPKRSPRAPAPKAGTNGEDQSERRPSLFRRGFFGTE